MAKRKISGVPVVDHDGTIVGMLSEGDLVRWHEGYSERQARWLDMLADGFQLAPAFLEGIREQQRKVKSIMAHGVTAVTEATPAREVVGLMHTKNIKHTVLQEFHFVGILARSDLVRALAQKLEEIDPLNQRSSRR